MLRYAQGMLAAHAGLWEPDTNSFAEAVAHSNRVIVEGCDLGPGRRVLDSGCGIGGTAISLAENTGAQVVGLTNCAAHVAVATEQAERRGVGHLVEFRHGDFMDLPFPDACFDVVVNHESACYAADMIAYLRGVRRVLKPGGVWRAMETLLSGAPLSAADEAAHARLQRGCCHPPLVSWTAVLEAAEKAGFESWEQKDLTPQVIPHLERVRHLCASFALVCYPPSPAQAAYYGLMDGSVAYYLGVRSGAFTYRFLSAVRPT